MTPQLQARVEEYGQSHRNPVNRALHLLGIPLLGVATLGLLCQLAVPVGAGVAALEPNAAWLALLAACVWYLAIDRGTGLLAFGVVVACYVVGSLLSAWVLAGLWVAGAVAHVIGHYGFEGKPPAFFSDPLSVLKAPAWLLCLVAGASLRRPHITRSLAEERRA